MTTFVLPAGPARDPVNALSLAARDAPAPIDA
jgi:hypothetical protein